MCRLVSSPPRNSASTSRTRPATDRNGRPANSNRARPGSRTSTWIRLGAVRMQQPRPVAANQPVGRRRNEEIAVVVGVAGAAGLGRLDDVVGLARRDIMQAERRPVPPRLHRREHRVVGRAEERRPVLHGVRVRLDEDPLRPAGDVDVGRQQARQPPRVRPATSSPGRRPPGSRCASRRRSAPGTSAGRPTASGRRRPRRRRRRTSACRLRWRSRWTLVLRGWAGEPSEGKVKSA